MRISLLPTLTLVALALAAPAYAQPIGEPPHDPVQNLSSPDAQDANRAKDAQSLQDLVQRHKTDEAALAQERYYSSYGPASRPAHDDGDSPWLIVAIGIGLITLIAVLVSVAVRTRRRSGRRVRVAV